MKRKCNAQQLRCRTQLLHVRTCSLKRNFLVRCTITFSRYQDVYGHCTELLLVYEMLFQDKTCLPLMIPDAISRVAEDTETETEYEKETTQKQRNRQGRRAEDDKPEDEQREDDEHDEELTDVTSAVSPSSSETSERLCERPARNDAKKVDWSSDEDAGAAYEAFKAGRSKRKQKRKRKSIAVKGVKDTKKSRKRKSIAGKGGKDTNESRKRKKYNAPVKFSTTDEDESSEDENIPVYVRQRRQEFEKGRVVRGRDGLRVPPVLKIDEFKDQDDGLSVEYGKAQSSSSSYSKKLETRPHFPDLNPCAPNEDVILKYSAGIVPAPLSRWLRDYQVQGAQFLHECFVYQKGGILGDDMGLGKTIQVIAFLTAAFGKRGDERDAKIMRRIRRDSKNKNWYPRILIICPGTLIHNWKAELDRWGWWHVDVFHGSTAVKEEVLQIARSGWLEIMITTYTTYRLNRSEVNTVDWDCVIADEFHCIKGSRSEISRALGEINALCRVGLTGTAIQNNYTEFFTLLNWTNPGRFGTASTWKRSISDPLKFGQAHDATVAQLARARKTATALVNNLLPQFFLRRTKALIADQLPKKSDRVVFCPLTITQARAYENYVESDVVQYILTSSDPCECRSGKKRGWCCHAYIPDHGKWQNYVFPVVVSLQKLSNHIALLIPSSSDLKEKQEKDVKKLQLAFPQEWRIFADQMDKVVSYANTEYSGKWAVLKKLLAYWYANGDKVLVFSHNVRLLKMLRMLFGANTSYIVSYLDGSMSYEDRALAVEEFNGNPSNFVFLISTKAGGVGLNITSANKVVIYDPNWNPSYDLQAADRAFRIGQTRDVEVFRLIASGTLDEIVYARQIYKQQQANIAYDASLERRYFKGVQDQPGKKGELFGLKNLFSFRGNDLVLKEIVNKTNIAESKAGVSIVGMDIDLDTQDGEGSGTNKPLPAKSFGEEKVDHVGNGSNGDNDEDAAASQLAALVTNGRHDVESLAKPNLQTPGLSKQKLAVEAIMSAAGVQYTHENTEVIGSSKIESRLSRRAIATATVTIGGADNDNEQGKDKKSNNGHGEYKVGGGYAFGDLSQDDYDDDVYDDDLDGGGSLDVYEPKPGGKGPKDGVGKGKNETDDKVALPSKEHAFKYRYRPPQDVRLRQFKTMAASFGFNDATDFAVLVESCTPAERKTLLDRFYVMRMRLRGVGAGVTNGDERVN